MSNSIIPSEGVVRGSEETAISNFIIDDPNKSLILPNIMDFGERYTLSLYAKSDREQGRSEIAYIYMDIDGEYQYSATDANHIFTNLRVLTMEHPDGGTRVWLKYDRTGPFVTYLEFAVSCEYASDSKFVKCFSERETDVVVDIRIPELTYNPANEIGVYIYEHCSNDEYLNAGKDSFLLTSFWTKYTTTFMATKSDLTLRFSKKGSYSIAYAKLETGTIATDWTPATEDMASSKDVDEAKDYVLTIVDAQFAKFEDSIASRVQVGDNDTLQVQKEDGTVLVFDLNKAINTAYTDSKEFTNEELTRMREGDLKTLSDNIETLSKRTAYISASSTKDTKLLNAGYFFSVDDSTMYYAAGNDLWLTNAECSHMEGDADDVDALRAFIRFDDPDGIQRDTIKSVVIRSYPNDHNDLINEIHLDPTYFDDGKYAEVAIFGGNYLWEDYGLTVEIYYEVYYGDSKPVLSLGNASKFSVEVTNEQISFKEGDDTPAYINNKKLNIDRAQIKGELQVGDENNDNLSGVFIWKVRSNGNLGLTWRPKRLAQTTALAAFSTGGDE